MQVLACRMKVEIKGWESVIEKMRVYSIKNLKFNQRDAFLLFICLKLDSCLAHDWIDEKILVIWGFFKKFWFLFEKNKQLLINLICKW